MKEGVRGSKWWGGKWGPDLPPLAPAITPGPFSSRASLPLLVEDWGLTYSALFMGTEEVVRKGRR